MNPCQQGERIAIVETRVDDLSGDIKEVLSELKSLNAELTRYKGFLGGIAFIISSLGVFWTFGKDWIMKHWS